MRKFASTIAVLLLLVLALPAQKSYQLKEGKRQFNAFNFADAVEYFKVVLKKDSLNVEANQLMADSYRLLNDATASLPYYDVLMNIAPTDENLLHYSEMLMSAQQYALAKGVLMRYVNQNPTDLNAKKKLENFDRYRKLAQDNPAYEIETLAINSSSSEFGPSIAGPNLIFSSNRQEKAAIKNYDYWTRSRFLQLHAIRLEAATMDGTTKLLSISQPNKKYHEGCTSYDSVHKILYFDRSNYYRSRAMRDSRGTVKLKMFQVGFKTEDMSLNLPVIETFPFNSDEYSVCHPAVSPDGIAMIFASDMPGGFGRTDLYITEKDASGSWGTPKNLGAAINTSEDDMFPFWAADSSLYFASKGHIGLGGLDVFITRKLADGNWAEVENPGSPINTASDDFGYVCDRNGFKGFLASNRAGGMGSDDIYGFTRSVVTRKLKLLVYDAESNRVIQDAGVSLSIGKALPNLRTDNNGELYLDIPVTAKELKTTVTKLDYIANTQTYALNPGLSEIRIPLVKVPPKKLPDYLVQCTEEPTDDCSYNYIVKVLDKETNLGIKNATVFATEILSGQRVLPLKETGCLYFFKLDKNKRYTIFVDKELEAEKSFYVSTLNNIDKNSIGPCAEQDFSMQKLQVGSTINIGMIYFDLDKYNIRPDAAMQLDKIVEIMKAYPNMTIEAASHTDCRSSMEYNEVLSSNRAKSCKAYIVSKGISESRIVSKGYGESQLVNECPCEGSLKSSCSEDEHQLNRRTTFTITSM